MFINQEQPLVSVYIPTHNRRQLLMRAVNSVLNQTYKNIEILVCDDGSTDDTEYFIKILCREHKNIIYLKNPTPMGACAARNLGINAANGDYITGLDDDDYFEPERIYWFVNTWQEKVYDNNIIGLFDSVNVLTPTGCERRHTVQTVTYQDLRRGNSLGSQVFAPRKNFILAGLFDPAMPAWQDWDLWLRMSQQFGYFVNINRFSYIVDECHDYGRITKKKEKTIRHAKNNLQLKIGKTSIYEKASLISTLHGYPQVMPTIIELLILLGAGKLKTFIYSAKKLLKSRIA
ncbi:MAG: glycosyltransferase [Erysipelotrichia bacterium]|nr:glycosyltransferase [Erysipelotrichia bacterium]